VVQAANEREAEWRLRYRVSDSKIAHAKAQNMTLPAPDFEAQYDSRLETYSNLTREALFCLRYAVKVREVALHSAYGRVKEREKFLEKIKRKSYDDPFAQMPDIAALRLVCLFESQMPTLDEAVRDAFDVLEMQDLTSFTDPMVFGYASVHYECTIDERYGASRSEGLRGIRFEVQTRTIAMDAWASVSHHLDYKPPEQSDLPPPLKRGLYALSGVLHVVDAHFESLYKEAPRGRHVSSDSAVVPAGSWEPIDLDTLLGHLQVRYINRPLGNAEDATKLVRELEQFNYRTMRDLELLLEAAEDAAMRYEVAHPPGDSDTYPSAEFVRIALRLADSNYRNHYLGTSAPRFAGLPVSALAEQYESYEKYLRY
jgi:putative GTP pyrophosphokinase